MPQNVSSRRGLFRGLLGGLMAWMWAPQIVPGSVTVRAAKSPKSEGEIVTQYEYDSQGRLTRICCSEPGPGELYLVL